MKYGAVGVTARKDVLGDLKILRDLGGRRILARSRTSLKLLADVSSQKNETISRRFFTALLGLNTFNIKSTSVV